MAMDLEQRVTNHFLSEGEWYDRADYTTAQRESMRELAFLGFDYRRASEALLLHILIEPETRGTSYS